MWVDGDLWCLNNPISRSLDVVHNFGIKFELRHIGKNALT